MQCKCDPIPLIARTVEEGLGLTEEDHLAAVVRMK